MKEHTVTEQTQPSAGPEPTATSETESASAIPQTIAILSFSRSPAGARTTDRKSVV